MTTAKPSWFGGVQAHSKCRKLSGLRVRDRQVIANFVLCQFFLIRWWDWSPCKGYTSFSMQAPDKISRDCSPAWKVFRRQVARSCIAVAEHVQEYKPRSMVTLTPAQAIFECSTSTLRYSLPAEPCLSRSRLCITPLFSISR